MSEEDADEFLDQNTDDNDIIQDQVGDQKSENEDDNFERIMSQDDIDSLLAIETGSVAETRTGIEAIIDSGMISYERLPMLEVVYDRLVRSLSTSLRNFTSDNVEVSTESIDSIRFGDYLNSIPLPAIIAVFKAEEWDNMGLMTLDSSLIYSIVDVLLGGRRGTAALRIEGRPYTTIERNLVERMISVVLEDLSIAFEPISAITMRFDRIETSPRFATIARPNNAAVLAKLRIDMENRGGRMDLLLPYATLEPVRELLLQMYMGEKFGRDSIWENHLATELWNTDVPVKIVLDEVTIPLEEALKWEKGSFLLLTKETDDFVELKCGDVSLFECHLGHRQEYLAVQIEKKIQQKES